MCEFQEDGRRPAGTAGSVPVADAVGMVLAHDVTEIRKDEFKGRAFKKGHVIQSRDIPRLRDIGKERVFVLNIAPDEMHEDDAAIALARALAGEGIARESGPKEGKITLIADRDGLLTVDRRALQEINELGEVLCATLHDNTIVKKGRAVAGTKAVPLVIKRSVIEEAAAIAGQAGVIAVREMRRPKAGIVITGNEVYHGRVRDGFADVIGKKIEDLGGEMVGISYAPDDKAVIRKRLEELLAAGADLLIATGGMSVDPDDVTRFAIRDLGAVDITYGSPVLPGAMVLVGYLPSVECGVPSGELQPSPNHSELRTPNSALVPILGIPACGMYHKTTVLDLILPRLLAGERIGRKELAGLGHGGFCLHCPSCTYPVCPFGK